MYLKELTIRGFKSFASATSLRFEPGVTAVVGPNGSGKSNIVDALAWVMGEQGAKALRGSSMEDVIFAGTSSRPPLGRAQVSLTIDNSDGVLDIDYTEVTISRTIFRNGGSEYAINGSACRLLDIQELLSDTGLGQQMHVIVGQGRLDAILHADPSGHRAFIEEAAGILKHRKRKERALRKLSNTETNLSRLDDLLAEIHRQMGPLGRQARVSRKADGIEVTLRDAQARIYAEDAVNVRQSLLQAREQLGHVRNELVQRQRSLAEVKLRIEQVEALSQESSPQIRRIDQVWHDLSQMQERYASLISIAEERSRSIREQITETSIGPDPQLLEKRAQELDQQADQHQETLDSARLTLDQCVEARASQEKQLAAARQTLTELQQTVRQRDAQLSSLRTLVTKEESALELAKERLRDGQEQGQSIESQLLQARTQSQTLNMLVQSGTDEDSLKAQEEAETTRSQARERFNALENERRKLNSEVIALQAKADALSDTLQSRSAVEQLDQDSSIRILGRLADFIQVEDGWEEPIAHALADYSAALVVSDQQSLLQALAIAHSDQLGKAALIYPLETESVQVATLEAAEQSDHGDVRSAASLVAVRQGADQPEQAQGVLTAVRLLLSRTAAVDGRQEAQDVLAAESASGKQGWWDQVLTREGDVFTSSGAIGGSGPATSDLALVARRDKALSQVAEYRTALDQQQANLDQAKNALAEAEHVLELAKAKRTESRLKAEQDRKSLAAANELVGKLEVNLQTSHQRAETLREEVDAHEAKLSDVLSALQQAQENEFQEVNVEQLSQRAHSLEEALDQARAQEMGAQVAWNEAKQKHQSLLRQAQLLRDQSKDAFERRQRIAELNRKRQELLASLKTVSQDARDISACIAHSLEQTNQERTRLQSQVSSHDSELKELRKQRGELEPQVERLRDLEHQLDIDRERWATKSGQVTQQISDDLGMSVDEIIKDYGPDKPVPVLDATGAPLPIDGATGDNDSGEISPDSYQTVPYVREEQVKRLQQAKRDLAALGKVNPLAAEEYESLKQRNQYLNDQRKDVVQSRDDLMDLVKELDQTMVDVFKSAFDDTATAFEQMFSTLFPGGKGRLRLENPHDLLTTGVLVEASPAGKKVKQLSLLSGGERSLTALALLFAIFTARPSPFYVMDEVEAALDDSNLSRLLAAFNQLRKRAQLIIITHQQRTMSIADALYGVTMRSDGVTAVISQKLSQGHEESLLVG